MFIIRHNLRLWGTHGERHGEKLLFLCGVGCPLTRDIMRRTDREIVRTVVLSPEEDILRSNIVSGEDVSVSYLFNIISPRASLSICCPGIYIIPSSSLVHLCASSYSIVHQAEVNSHSSCDSIPIDFCYLTDLIKATKWLLLQHHSTGGRLSAVIPFPRSASNDHDRRERCVN